MTIDDNPVAIAISPFNIVSPCNATDRTSGWESGKLDRAITGESSADNFTATNHQTRKSESKLPDFKTRSKIKAAWEASKRATVTMVSSAEAQDEMGLTIAADDLDIALAQLWDLRETLDLNWKTILNHVQGVVKQFFSNEQRAGILAPEQCKRIQEIIHDFLSPSTKSLEDLNEVVRLVDDAGFDPYAAISGDPLSSSDD